MCRIAGIIDKSSDQVLQRKNLKAMCDLMQHGGPDGEGFFQEEVVGLVFGHRRLSLLDLSAGGHQPMTYLDQLTISFNGEIYNYLELKALLISLGFDFKTESDTEVILVGFACWGTAIFEKLSGMFAFALYDQSNGITYLVRDTSGIKPLYYSIIDKRLLFASEVKAFSASDSSATENEDWRIYFLAFGHIPEPYTTLKEVQMLPKGNYLKWEHASGKAEIICFHCENYEVTISDEQMAIEAIKNGFEESVKRHLISDAPIGVFLSGGIDSSIITLLAGKIQKEAKQPLHTIAINFSDVKFSEKEYQDFVTKQTSGIHSSYQLDESSFNAHFSSALAAMDQPTTDGINSWFVNYYAKKNGLKAVLSGIGADELFGGYPSFKRMGLVNFAIKLPQFILKSFIRFNSTSLKRFYFLSYKNTVGKYLFLRGFFAPDEIGQLLNISQEKVDQVLRTLPLPPIPAGLENEEQASWLETNLYMQNQLLKDTDAMSMKHGVEVRVPFLDQNFKNIVFGIRNDIKFNRQQTKGLLIDSFIKLLPRKIWDRPKMGFTFPFQNWLRNNATFMAELGKTDNPKGNELIERFKNDDLHWSKAMALYHVMKKPVEKN